MIHRGPFQLLPFCHSVILLRMDIKSTFFQSLRASHGHYSFSEMIEMNFTVMSARVLNPSGSSCIPRSCVNPAYFHVVSSSSFLYYGG